MNEGRRLGAPKPGPVVRAAAAIRTAAERRRLVAVEQGRWRENVDRHVEAVKEFASELKQAAPEIVLEVMAEEGMVRGEKGIVVVLGRRDRLGFLVDGDRGKAMMYHPPSLRIDLQLTGSVTAFYSAPLVEMYDRTIQTDPKLFWSSLPSLLNAEVLRELLADFIDRAMQEDWPDGSIKA